MTQDQAGDFQRQSQFLARLTGALFIATFVTSIPAVLAFYVPALHDPDYVLGSGRDLGLAFGAFLEMLLILANIGTGVALYPVLKRQNRPLALGYVTARLVESGFIAVGIVVLLALATLRAGSGGADAGALRVAGRSLVAIHDWTFLLGPGFIVGVGNGLLLGYLMYASRLVPRAMSVLGLVGGPLIVLSGTAVLLGAIAPQSTWQVVATLPEFFWELSLGIWLLARGFDPAALASLGPAGGDRAGTA